MGSVTHTPKAGALLTGTEYESDPHVIALEAGDIPALDYAATGHDHDADYAAAVHGHAGEDITSGTVADARIASTIARDSEVTAAISAHEGAGDPHPGYLTTAEGNAAYQPLDSDLTAIAALTTTAFGRGLLELANQAALLSAAGAAASGHTHTFSVSTSFVIDGGGSAVTTGIKGYLEVPFAGTITAARLAADQTGSIVVDIKKATYSGLFTTSSITAAAKPTLSSAQKSENTTLTGWTTSVSAGDWLEIVVDSAATLTRVTLSLTVSRSV